MIPTWQPHPEHLERAIRSVLEQPHADSEIQIELVDDCSVGFDPFAFLDRFPKGRISAYRQASRLGLAGNWNSCLARARGRWVHLLHQDDFVLAGFYEALRKGIKQAPSAGAAFCESYFTDDQDFRWAPRLIRATDPGILDDWLQHVFVRLSIQCSAIIVRRDVYETVGGFDAGFGYALDWDMWKRVAVRYPIWYHPIPLSCYRMHTASETARQRATGSHIRELFRSIDHSASLLPPAIAGRTIRRARFHYTVFAIENAFFMIRSERSWSSAVCFVRIARRATSAAVVLAALMKFVVRAGLRAVRLMT
jgi:GT2 family glycosyltransferase